MVSRDITYTDYDGKEVTKRFWFNLTESDVQEIDMDFPGGLAGVIDGLKEDPNIVKILKAFKAIILKAYGVRTPDKKFYKDDIETKAFAASDAYSKLFMGFMTDSHGDILEFITGMFPKGSAIANDPDIRKQLQELKQGTTETTVTESAATE